MSKPSAPGNDYTASDVLAPQFWTGRAERPAPGLDVACTKIAVDFQNLQRATADEAIHHGLAMLREATSADGAFSAFFDATGSHIESVMVAGGSFAQVHPEALRGIPLERLPYVASRTDHLRLSEFRDTADAAPRAGQGCGTAGRPVGRRRIAGRLSHPWTGRRACSAWCSDCRATTSTSTCSCC